MKGWLEHLRKFDGELAKSKNADILALRGHLSAGVQAVTEAVDWLLANFGKDVRAASAGSVPFLKLMGIVAGGWQLARAARIAEAQLAEGGGDKAYLEAKIATARFFGDHVLVQAPALKNTVVAGGPAAMALADDQFLAA